MTVRWQGLFWGMVLVGAAAAPAYSQSHPQTLQHADSVAAAQKSPLAQPQPAAAPTAATAAGECTLVSISVNFAFDGRSNALAKNELDERLYKLAGFLIDNRIDHLETQSLSYKISSDQKAVGNDMRRTQMSQSAAAASVVDAPRLYHLTGTAEYLIDSSDSAFKLGQFLTQQKFEVTVSNKPAKAGQCNQPDAKKSITGSVPAPAGNFPAGGGSGNTNPNPEPAGNTGASANTSASGGGMRNQIVKPFPASEQRDKRPGALDKKDAAVPDKQGAINRAVSGMLEAVPPRVETEPENGSVRNGNIPEIPGLEQEPPSAEPLQEKR